MSERVYNGKILRHDEDAGMPQEVIELRQRLWAVPICDKREHQAKQVSDIWVCKLCGCVSDYPFEPYAAVSEGPNDGTCCDNGKFGEPHDCCKQCDAAQPQPAGTREQISDARDDADRQYGELQWKQKEIDDLNQKFAALQQSHDVCVAVLEEVRACAEYKREHSQTRAGMKTAARALEQIDKALANAEKLRAAK